MHEVKNNIDYLTFEILEDGIVTFTPSRETNILSWSFDDGSTWTEGNEIEVKKGDVVRCKGECFPVAEYGIGQFQTTCSYNLSGKTSSLLPVPVELTEDQIIDTIFAACCGMYTMQLGSSGEVALQTAYPTLSKKDIIIASLSEQQVSWEQLVQQMSPLLMDTQEHLLQRNYNLIIQEESITQMIPNYAELTPEEFFITFTKLNVPTATELDGIGVGLFIGMQFSDNSSGYEYYRLFSENSRLIDASKLTVDKFNQKGCMAMFHSCTSLKYPPLLPAPVIDYCYSHMFQECTSLITAPELTATTLAEYCYWYMFTGCTSLTIAPTLPATTLAYGCYHSMFYGCTSLNYIKMLATDINASDCLYNWVAGVADNGTFIKHIDATWDAKVIPTGWNIEYNFIPHKCSKLTITADDVLGRATYTNIYYTAEVEGLLDTGEPHTAILTGTDISKKFEKNMSTTEVVNKSIDYTYMGVTATTTIIQDIYVDICDGYLTINALEDGLTAKLSRNTIEYCIDSDDNWITLAANTETFPINAGQTLSFRGHIVPNSTDGSGTFTINKQCNLTGNCNSLLFGDLAYKNYNLSKYTKAFYNLFYKCTSIKNVSPKFLPATTLADSCYLGMFDKCTSLVVGSDLPATTLKSTCYGAMFQGCSSLVTAPELPATKLAQDCYATMFRNCTSLTTASDLPATTLAKSCYSNMFSGCTSLPVAPELPATKLAGNCYQSMFSGCTSLRTVPELPATTMAHSCYSNMFEGCTLLETAPELPATKLDSQCYDSMFRGCTSLVKAPEELPTTIILVFACYRDMFRGCTSLVTAPELPATILSQDCYRDMFYGCTNLNNITMLATDISAISCLNNWVNGVSSTGTFIKHPDTEIPTGTSGIPNGWIVETIDI